MPWSSSQCGTRKKWASDLRIGWSGQTDLDRTPSRHTRAIAAKTVYLKHATEMDDTRILDFLQSVRGLGLRGAYGLQSEQGDDEEKWADFHGVRGMKGG